MGDIISAGSGFFLLVSCCFVMSAYWPRDITWPHKMPPARMLRLGIFLGFLLAAANTIWWQILNIAVVSAGLMTAGEFQAIGKYLDFIFKGWLGLVGFMHWWAYQRSKREAGE